MKKTRYADAVTDTMVEVMTANAMPVLSFESFMRLLRSEATELDSYLGTIGTTARLESTRANVHCRYLKLDGNCSPRTKDLADRLARELINYAIPRADIEAAFKNSKGSSDAKHFSSLHRRAARLFTDVANTGEGGELLLYLMVETYLRIPQLFCKMPLKTSSRVHFHGVDGVYGTYSEASGVLALYWGESKLYQSPTSAIQNCFESLAPFVSSTGGSQAAERRDLQLLSDNIDLGDPQLENAILRYLDPDDPAFNKLEYRGAALVGFDTDHYRSGGGRIVEADLVKALEEAMTSWGSSAGHYIAKHKLSEIEIELFCLPFPSVEEFRKAFLAEIRIG